MQDRRKAGPAPADLILLAARPQGSIMKARKRKPTVS